MANFKILSLLSVGDELYTQYKSELGKLDYRKVHGIALVEFENGTQTLVPMDFYDLESGMLKIDKGENYVGLTEDRLDGKKRK